MNECRFEDVKRRMKKGAGDGVGCRRDCGDDDDGRRIEKGMGFSSYFVQASKRSAKFNNNADSLAFRIVGHWGPTTAAKFTNGPNTNPNFQGQAAKRKGACRGFQGLPGGAIAVPCF